MVYDPRGWTYGRAVKISRETREAVFKRSVLCVYCDKRATCVDHLIPIELGGDDEIENLVAACAGCNASKGSLLLKDARHRMALRILGWPPLSPQVLEWMRSRCACLGPYDRFQFAFEKKQTKAAAEIRRLVAMAESGQRVSHVEDCNS